MLGWPTDPTMLWAVQGPLDKWLQACRLVLITTHVLVILIFWHRQVSAQCFVTRNHDSDLSGPRTSEDEGGGETEDRSGRGEEVSWTGGSSSAWVRVCQHAHVYGSKWIWCNMYKITMQEPEPLLERSCELQYIQRYSEKAFKAI